MTEGTTLTQRQADYLDSIECACIAAWQLAKMAVEDYPEKDEKEILEYFMENHYRMKSYLNSIFALMDCAVGIFQSGVL